MPRPVYETERDLKNEEHVRKIIEKQWNGHLIKMPRHYGFDFVVVSKDGRVRAAVEVKTREVPSWQYPTYILSSMKWMRGLQYADTYGIPFIVIYYFVDRIVYCVASLVRDRVGLLKIGGRVDRGDWQDKEPVIHIPANLFKTLNG